MGHIKIGIGAESQISSNLATLPEIQQDRWPDSKQSHGRQDPWLNGRLFCPRRPGRTRWLGDT